MIDLNPLDVLKKRRIAFLPIHFVTTNILELSIIDNSLENWVQTKLKGRYCITKIPTIDNNGKLKSTLILGLEDQKEMTYFLLAYLTTRR